MECDGSCQLPRRYLTNVGFSNDFIAQLLANRLGLRSVAVMCPMYLQGYIIVPK